METRVKERLVGAVILVALIVALVPEILSGPHQPTDVGGSAGSQQPIRTYTVDLEERGLPTADPPAEAATPQVTFSEVPTLEAPAEVSEPDDAPAAAASVPAPVTQPRPEPPPRAPASTSGWVVQLGSFSHADNAARLARELRAAGYKAFVSPHESNGEKRMRVRVGPEQNRARAEQLEQRLRRDGHPGTVVEQR